jgi:hypothetical protein
MLYYINNLSSLNPGDWTNLFRYFVTLFSVAIVATVYYVYRAYYGYGYKHMPNATEINGYTKYWVDYYDQNYDHYFSQSGNTKQELIQMELDKKIYEIYTEVIDVNKELNEKKLIYLRRVGWCLIAAVFFGAISLWPFYMAKEKNSIQKIEVVNLKAIEAVLKGGEKVNQQNASSGSQGNQNTQSQNAQSQARQATAQSGQDKQPPIANPPVLKAKTIYENFEKKTSPADKKE